MSKIFNYTGFRIQCGEQVFEPMGPALTKVRENNKEFTYNYSPGVTVVDPYFENLNNLGSAHPDLLYYIVSFEVAFGALCTDRGADDLLIPNSRGAKIEGDILVVENFLSLSTFKVSHKVPKDVLPSDLDKSKNWTRERSLDFHTNDEIANCYRSDTILQWVGDESKKTIKKYNFINPNENANWGI